MAISVRKRGVRDFPLESLYGGKAAPEALVRRGLADLEKELDRQFQTERAVELETAKHLKKVHGPLLNVVAKDGRAAEGIRGLRGLDNRLAKENRRLAPPKVAPEAQRVFTGSIGATVVPAYNYQWTWNATSGGPALSVSANRNTGQMGFNIWNNSRNASGSARAAVGIYFRPPTETGILKLWSNPAFTYSWWTICAFASAHSDAFIGLYVGRYNLSGGFDGAPVNQQISLWNDDSWWSGAGSHSGSNSGYPLFAQFNVDRSHYYAMWVWCGGRATGAGWSTFSGSGAGSNLSVTVPSFTWELF